MHIESEGAPRTLAPKFGLRRLPASKLIATSPGGGGWGDPKTRPVEDVLRDWRGGLVSTEAARDSYGVVLTGDPDDPASDLGAVDHAATAALRGG